MLNDKKVYVLTARGGVYQDTPADTQTPFLKSIFGLMGMTNVTFVYAEGLNMGDEPKEKALTSARAHIDQLTPVRESVIAAE